ncbi:MAG TPA: hypothetical protein VFA55_03020 [Candidatus Kapabacteria bacterium]|nr:hypothetical protein [Candidatus Kapabacteria bacterium]
MFLIAFALTGIDACNNFSPTENTLGDTTSHNFVWAVDTFGTIEGRYPDNIKDVCIINDTDAWIVGEFHNDTTDRGDSSGKYVDYFNSAHWNGKNWELERIYYLSPTPSEDGGIEPLRSCFGLGPKDIWVGSNYFYRGDGQKWTVYQWSSGPSNKMWGTSDTDMFFAGVSGGLAHWDGVYLRTSTTGNYTGFSDIYGLIDPANGEESVLAVASPQLYKYTLNTSWLPVNSKGLEYGISGVWYTPGGPFYCAGSSVYRIRSLTSDTMWVKLDSATSAVNYSVNAMRGNALNDLVVVGDSGGISHWNGSSWHRFTELANPEDRLISVAMKGNLIIAVGSQYELGVVYVGRR